MDHIELRTFVRKKDVNGKYVLISVYEKYSAEDIDSTIRAVSRFHQYCYRILIKHRAAPSVDLSDNVQTDEYFDVDKRLGL